MDSEFGPIHDVVKESITLCHKLEATAGSARGEGHTSLPTWHEIRVQFAHGVTKNPNFSANWDSRQQVWTLIERSTGDAAPDPDALSLFKETARSAIALLGKQSENTHGRYG